MTYANLEELENEGDSPFGGFLLRRPNYSDELAAVDSEPFTHFDVFLSHSYADRDDVVALTGRIEALGYRVYVDWIDDDKLDRSNVTDYNVETLRNRLRAGTCLIYAISKSSASSAWMPWELGFFDGHSGARIGIYPLDDDAKAAVRGREYLSIYSQLDEDTLPDFLLANADRAAGLDNTRALADLISRQTIEAFENPIGLALGQCHWWVAAWHDLLRETSRNSEVATPMELWLYEMRKQLQELRRSASSTRTDLPEPVKDQIYRHFGRLWGQ